MARITCGKRRRDPFDYSNLITCDRAGNNPRIDPEILRDIIFLHKTRFVQLKKWPRQKIYTDSESELVNYYFEKKGTIEKKIGNCDEKCFRCAKKIVSLLLAKSGNTLGMFRILRHNFQSDHFEHWNLSETRENLTYVLLDNGNNKREYFTHCNDNKKTKKNKTDKKNIKKKKQKTLTTFRVPTSFVGLIELN